ncbi:methanogenesis marker 12 protein [Methanospirillum sp.]|uniref:methanogenesis marker 12 protein n=1 Tax=Methanospirillum sp. TaxID=45200 RepID=UPI002CBB06FA|nr:methanogenesis marker 12 protein [Methanospirillum sp.]HPP78326.1 methanogenesis marker 12 protein [Methanospirillum sp.]
MFVGIDHGTTAMRFAGGGRVYKIPRAEAVSFQLSDLLHLTGGEEIEGFAVTYSMGDNFSVILPIASLTNRGLVSREGAGEHTGGGTRVFDIIKESGIPAIAIPGLHRGSHTDPRFKVYSHQASPEKIGLAYEVVYHLGPTCIVSDISSNTVTLLIKDNHIVGGFDACLFAPGWVHGALDLDAIRAIDAGRMTANDAFLHAGVRDTLQDPDREAALAMFAAMECASLRLLAPDAPVALCGSRAGSVSDEIGRLLGCNLLVLDEWTAAKGLSRIAEDVFSKKVTQILDIPVRL